MCYREKGNNNVCSSGKREIKIANILHFVNGPVWKTLFGRTTLGLEQSEDQEDTYWISETRPVTNLYTSVGGMGGPNCASFVAGII